MAEDQSKWLRPRDLPPLTGDERFVGVDATVAEFWRWAFNDLRDNVTRAILGEFLVAKAVGDARVKRRNWDNFDVENPDGLKIEVKCSGYLQSWTQKAHSKPVFSGLSARVFDWDRNEYSIDPSTRADVFVFAVQIQRDPTLYDVLDLAHWEFWIIDSTTVTAQTTADPKWAPGMKWVRDNAIGPVRFEELAAAISRAGTTS